MADLAERKLTAPLKQVYRVIALCLAMGMSEEEAAAHSHVSVDRLKAYMRDPRFDEMLQTFNREIEKNVVERVVRRRVRTVAKLQLSLEDAADRVVQLMHAADHDSVSLQAAKGILRQGGIDLDKTALEEDDLGDPEAEMRKSDPSFFDRQSETMKELGDGEGS